MNKNAKKWVKALESGEYEQGKLRLCTLGDKFDYFCCLGVACDLYVREKGSLKVTTENKTVYYDNEAHSLPIKVMDWLGLRTSYGDFDNNMKALARFNDSGYSFKEIAYIIKSEPEGLFVE